MVKAEYGKSEKWLSTHCALCGKKFDPKEDRAYGTATFRNDEVVKINAHEDCARTALILQGAEQVKKGILP